MAKEPDDKSGTLKDQHTRGILHKVQVDKNSTDSVSLFTAILHRSVAAFTAVYVGIREPTECCPIIQHEPGFFRMIRRFVFFFTSKFTALLVFFVREIFIPFFLRELITDQSFFTAVQCVFSLMLLPA